MNSCKWYNAYKDIGNGNPLNAAQNIIVDGDDTNIPLNLPTFIVGSKNAGKSTLINTIINATSSNNVYSKYIYIYTDNVDSTLAECCHTLLLRVPYTSAKAFLHEYLRAKTQFMSWVRFLDKNDITVDSISNITNDSLYKNNSEEMLKHMLEKYTDNVVDEYIREQNIIVKHNGNTSTLTNKQKQNATCFGPFGTAGSSAGPFGTAGSSAGPFGTAGSFSTGMKALGNIGASDNNRTREQKIKQNPVLQVINHAMEFIVKYSHDFEINVDDVTYNIDGFTVDTYDCIIVDDIGQVTEIFFPTTMAKSIIYPYLTISRHALTGWVFAGQSLLQMTKYARKEMNTFIIGYGMDITELETTHIPKPTVKQIEHIYPNLHQHDFICYNGINNNVTTMLMSNESLANEDKCKQKFDTIDDKRTDRENNITEGVSNIDAISKDNAKQFQQIPTV